MGELSVRRNRGMGVPRYQGTAKAGKQAGAAQSRPAAGRASATVSETLRQLMGRVSQVERHIREGRRTLQTGEAALAEIEDNLGRMEELARQSAEAGAADRAALQKELEQLRGEIGRIARGGMEAGLFQDGDGLDGLDALAGAVMDGLAARQEGAQGLPAWLLRGMTGDAPNKAALLAALGVDGSAIGAQLLCALGRLSLEDSPAAGYLAALYLGAVISGGTPSGAVNWEQAAEGLRQLLETVSGGVSPDEAVELLTGGAFTGMADFEAQFTAGTAPGLEPFLTDLLLSGGGGGEPASVLALLADGGGGGMELELLMGLLSALEGSGDGMMELLNQEGGAPEGAAPRMETAQLGTLQASGRDVSGVAAEAEGGAVTVGGAQEVILRSLEGQAPEIRLAGSGTVKLQQVDTPLLDVRAAQARLVSAGESVLAQLRLGEGTALTLDGGGLLRIGELYGGAGSVLRLAGGAAVLAGGEDAAPAVPVVIDGPAVLLAAEGIAVRDAQGEALEPFDLVWKTLLPEWSAITALEVDGRQGQLALRSDQIDPLRLWLLKGNSEERWPAHTITLRGRDQAGRARTRQLYVRWDGKKGGFQEVPMYPNPFTITGGESDVDWRYEQETQTLHILSGQVTAISGGAGVDANRLPFSGRIALADGIGGVELTLDGVVCRVSSGRAFYLGRENDVTLLLRRGTDNVFESGPGCAGISLGDATSLRIDQARGGRGEPDGTLAAAGASGGAGIGRDSGAGRGRTGPILICGGVVAAAGSGGGAGIGGSLGSGVGDIRIQGGTVTARADCCAAAIGAGIQGACGDIVITGSARVAEARGGGPDGDIGGCLFGSCGKVQVSAGTDLGGARLWTREGLSLPMGEGSVTLPRFRVSAHALRLDALDISNREAARSALAVLTADRRWVTRLQGAYGALYGQLAQSFGGRYSVRQYFSVVRDTREASSLTCDIREVLRQSPLANFLRERGMEDVGQLLR